MKRKSCSLAMELVRVTDVSVGVTRNGGSRVDDSMRSVWMKVCKKRL